MSFGRLFNQYNLDVKHQHDIELQYECKRAVLHEKFMTWCQSYWIPTHHGEKPDEVGSLHYKAFEQLQLNLDEKEKIEAYHKNLYQSVQSIVDQIDVQKLSLPKNECDDYFGRSPTLLGLIAQAVNAHAFEFLFKLHKKIENTTNENIDLSRFLGEIFLQAMNYDRYEMKKLLATFPEVMNSELTYQYLAPGCFSQPKICTTSLLHLAIKNSQLEFTKQLLTLGNGEQCPKEALQSAIEEANRIIARYKEEKLVKAEIIELLTNYKTQELLSDNRAPRLSP